MKPPSQKRDMGHPDWWRVKKTQVPLLRSEGQLILGMDGKNAGPSTSLRMTSSGFAQHGKGSLVNDAVSDDSRFGRHDSFS
jgi:hypothetical protein